MITVINNNDSGVGSLRQAVIDATNQEIIEIQSGLNPIVLTSPITINKELTINGNNNTLDGNNSTNLLILNSNYTISINDLILRNAISSDRGAAIFTQQKVILNLTNCTIRDNIAPIAAGLYLHYQGTLNIDNCQFINNDSSNGTEGRAGGAIASNSECNINCSNSTFNNNKGINGAGINVVHTGLIVDNCTFDGNNTTYGGSIGPHTKGYGAAIYTDGASKKVNGVAIGGSISITNSTFTNNIAAGQGGALFLFVYPDDVVLLEDSIIDTNIIELDVNNDALGGGARIGNADAGCDIRRCTFSNNIARSKGGGLYIGEDTQLTIENCTISANQATDGSTSGLGGGIFFGGVVNSSVTHCTFANNHAGFQGGTFWNNYSTVTLTNNIVAYSTANNPWGVKVHTGGNYLDGGGNIQWPDKHPTDNSDRNITSSVLIADPLLEVLTNNGGNTETHAIPLSSQAIDIGINTSLSTDQRGLMRSSGLAPDAGSFEYILQEEVLIDIDEDSIPNPIEILNIPGETLNYFQVGVTNDTTSPIDVTNLILPTGFEVIDSLPTQIGITNRDTFHIRLAEDTFGEYTGIATFDTSDGSNHSLNLLGKVSNYPTFTSSPITQIDEGDTYTYNVVTTDPDSGDSLTITGNIPNWLTLIDNGDGTATLQGTPNSTNTGTHNVELTVTDSLGLSVNQTYSLDVTANLEPQITSNPQLTTSFNTTYKYDITSNEADVTFNGSYPTWLTLTDNGDGTAILQGTPTIEGDYSIDIIVTDSLGLSSSQQYELTVTNKAPLIISNPITQAIGSQLYSYRIRTSKPDIGDSHTLSLITSPSWLSLTQVSDTSAILEGIPSEVGQYPIVIKVEDSLGNTNEQHYSLNVFLGSISQPIEEQPNEPLISPPSITLDSSNNRPQVTSQDHIYLNKDTGQLSIYKDNWINYATIAQWGSQDSISSIRDNSLKTNDIVAWPREASIPQGWERYTEIPDFKARLGPTYVCSFGGFWLMEDNVEHLFTWIKKT